MLENLKCRVEGLISTWDQASPFTISVKLLIKDWSETIRRESKDSSNSETTHKKES